MLKHISILAVIMLFGLGIGYANQGTRKVVIPVEKTSPADAKQMYNGYCAPCHGVDGRGTGPVAGQLKRAPTDLTVLARSNDGRFPELHVVSVLRFGNAVPAHGTAGMPVWGQVLANMDAVNSDLTDLRISNLTRYLESLQRK